MDREQINKIHSDYLNDCESEHDMEQIFDLAYKAISSAEPKTGHCEDCKQFRKLPYHADTLGKCIHHTGFCPKGDWYCADYESQKSEDKG